MDDSDKTKLQLLNELALLRQQVRGLQDPDTTRARIEGAPPGAWLDGESIMAAIREPLVVLDGDFRIVAANRAFYQTFQVTAEETEHQLLYDLGNRQWDIPALRHLLEDVLPASAEVKDFAVTHEFPAIGKKTMVLNARRIDRDGAGASLILLAMEDITERTRAEGRLRQDHDWLDVTLTSIGDAVLATDTNAAITFLNPEAERLTGWTAQDAHGRKIDEILVLINQDTRQPVENPVNRVLREGTIVGMATRTMLKTRDGREIPVADSGAPIRGSDGRLHGVVMVFRDITPHYEAEQELRAAKEAAETASRTKSEFLATMSHELRTPLSVVIGYTDILSEGTFGPRMEQEVSALRVIRRNAFELLELITAILDLSRLEAGRLPLEMKELQLSALLAEVKAETQGVWEQSSLTFVWNVADKLPLLRTDPGKLKMVLKNLFGNAVKFTEQGGIVVEAHGQQDGIAISVSDTGIGIPPEEVRNIFEPFLQVDRSTTRRYGGIGLGLHIVKRLLEMLGGTIEVQSTVGHGSTFRVWVPSDGNSPSA